MLMQLYSVWHLYMSSLLVYLSRSEAISVSLQSRSVSFSVSLSATGVRATRIEAPHERHFSVTSELRVPARSHFYIGILSCLCPLSTTSSLLLSFPDALCLRQLTMQVEANVDSALESVRRRAKESISEGALLAAKEGHSASREAYRSYSTVLLIPESSGTRTTTVNVRFAFSLN